MKTVAPLIAAALAWTPLASLGHGSEAGAPIDPVKAERTIAVEMDDTMRYTPAEITVRRGEGVRYVVHNNGKVVHELVFGDAEELKEHAEHMRQHAGMMHDHPNGVQVPPGATREMGWRFTRAGEFLYGCLVPGHFEAGMVGKVLVTESR